MKETFIETVKVLGPVITAIISGHIAIKLATIQKQQYEIHKQINSRMDELVETKVTVAKIEGKEEGRKEEVARVEDKKKNGG